MAQIEIVREKCGGVFNYRGKRLVDGKPFHLKPVFTVCFDALNFAFTACVLLENDDLL